MSLSNYNTDQKHHIMSHKNFVDLIFFFFFFTPVIYYNKLDISVILPIFISFLLLVLDVHNKEYRSSHSQGGLILMQCILLSRLLL